MAIEAKTTGNGKFYGRPSSLFSFTVSEDSTPLDPNDSGGATGQIGFAALEDEQESVFLVNDSVVVSDDTKGTTSGRVVSVGGAVEGVLDVVAESRMSALLATVTLAPQHSTLELAFRYYLAAAGVTANIFVDPSIASRPVAFPAYSGDLWILIKQICAVQQVEVSLVSNNIVLRPIRQRLATLAKATGISWNLEDYEIARNIEVVANRNKYIAGGLVFPQGGWNHNTFNSSGFSVGAGQSLYFEVELNAGIESIDQPQVVSGVPRYYSASSVYSVLGKDNQPISPADWVDGGGSVTVEILPSLTRLGITINGMLDVERGPYRVAGLEALDGETYNSLRVVGNGVFSDPITLTIATGASFSSTAVEVGVTVNNQVVSSESDAYSLGAITAGKWAKPYQTVNFETTLINRRDAGGSIVYPTFADFNPDWPNPKTFAQFDAAWAGQTFDDFKQFYFDKVSSNFVNQAFGNVAGTRFYFRDIMYRIRRASITASSTVGTAEADTTFSDFNPIWSGATFATFDGILGVKTFQDFDLAPMRR